MLESLRPLQKTLTLEIDYKTGELFCIGDKRQAETPVEAVAEDPICAAEFGKFSALRSETAEKDAKAEVKSVADLDLSHLPDE